MLPKAPPNAEGTFDQTPFAHLMVYLLDRKLTGELFVVEGDDVVHALAFVRGVPRKIRMGNGKFLLGELLVEKGLVEATTIRSAVGMGGLLGDILVLSGSVPAEALAEVARDQLERRLDYLFTLTAGRYLYFDRGATLGEWGVTVDIDDPLPFIWRGIRAHGQRSKLMEPTITGWLEAVLQLHPLAPLDRLGLCPHDREIFEVVEIDPTTGGELLKLEGQDPEEVKRILYAGIILRIFDGGKGAGPVGVEESRALARVQLRSQVVRSGLVDETTDGPWVKSRVTLRGKELIPRDDDGDSSPGLAPPSSSPAPRSAPRSSPAAAHASEPTPTDEREATSGIQERLPDVGVRTPEPLAEAEPAPNAGLPQDQAVLLESASAMPLDALVPFAREQIVARRFALAQAILEMAEVRLLARGDNGALSDVRAYRAEAASHGPTPGLKALSLELDGWIRERDVPSLRLVRADLRRRLGDDGGARQDLERAIELGDPGGEATSMLAAIGRPKAGSRPGLFRKSIG